MKTITESRPASSSSFIHLAYVAGAKVKPRGEFFFGGWILLFLGIALVFRTGRRKDGIRKKVLVVLLRRTRTALLGLAFLLLGTTSIVISYKLGETIYPHGSTMTKVHVVQISDYVTLHMRTLKGSEGPRMENPIKALPTTEGIQDLATALGVAATTNTYETLCRDGWDRPMKLKTLQGTNGMSYQILSSGKDQVFGTPDDLTYPCPLPPHQSLP